MITVQNLSKSYGSHILLDEVSFQINPREKIGLVGRNGHGKSTLFRILTGEEEYESGQISVPKDYAIGWLRQRLDFSQQNALDEAALALPEHDKDSLWMAERILSGLGFSQDDFQKAPSELSGGFQIRLNLAKILLSDADLLLLDEPNNYLDITSIRWLGRFLQEWKKEIFLITHDRYFMDLVVSHTMAIHRHKLRKVQGDTEKLYEQIAQEEEIHEKTRLNDEKKRKEAELFISRFRAKARLAGMVQSRIKALEKSEKKEKLEQIKDLDFSFHYKPFPAKNLMNAEELSFGYEKESALIEHFDLTVQNHDRIAIIGKNGKGKTTLLKLLYQKLDPWQGKLYFHPECSIGYFEQTNIKSLSDGNSVLDEISLANRDIDLQKVRNIAGSMMFSGDDALKKIKVLSGGEKCRVMLGKILASPVNLLFLDEPTNHLDLHSADALLDAIDEFPGAVIMVTHNEMFLHSIANRLIIFQNSEVKTFEGSYQEFLNKIGWEDESGDNYSNGSKSAAKNSKKEQRKLRAQIQNEKARLLKPWEKKIQELETLIEELEQEEKITESALISATEQQDGKRIQELSKKLHQLKEKIEINFSELETVHLRYDEERRQFDEKLAELES